MSVLTIKNPDPKLEWLRHTNEMKKKDDPAFKKVLELSSFVSEFPSPVDEIKDKSGTKTESQSLEKKKKPFMYTSENWIG